MVAITEAKGQVYLVEEDPNKLFKCCKRYLMEYCAKKEPERYLDGHKTNCTTCQGDITLIQGMWKYTGKWAD